MFCWLALEYCAPDSSVSLLCLPWHWVLRAAFCGVFFLSGVLVATVRVLRCFAFYHLSNCCLRYRSIRLKLYGGVVPVVADGVAAGVVAGSCSPPHNAPWTISRIYLLRHALNPSAGGTVGLLLGKATTLFSNYFV